MVGNSSYARFGHKDYDAITNYGVLQQDNGDIWLGANQGFIRRHFDHVARWTTATSFDAGVDNGVDLGAVQKWRTGYFGTSVDSPKVVSSGNLNLESGENNWVNFYSGANAVGGARNGFGLLLWNGNSLGFEAASTGLSDVALHRIAAGEIGVYDDRLASNLATLTANRIKAPEIESSSDLELDVAGNIILKTAGSERGRWHDGGLDVTGDLDASSVISVPDYGGRIDLDEGSNL